MKSLTICESVLDRKNYHNRAIVGNSSGDELYTGSSRKVVAYIGVGQVTNFSQGKIYAAECAIKKR